MSLHSAALLALFTLLPGGLAHGPGIDVVGARLVTSAEGAFLEMNVDAPDVAERHDLVAVSTPYGGGVFEQKQAGGYHRVDAIPVETASQRFGPATAFRVRLPHLPRGTTEALLSVMFSGGELVHTEMIVAPPERDRSSAARIWLPVFVVLVGIGAGLPVFLRRRRAA